MLPEAVIEELDEALRERLVSLAESLIERVVDSGLVLLFLEEQGHLRLLGISERVPRVIMPSLRIVDRHNVWRLPDLDVESAVSIISALMWAARVRSDLKLNIPSVL